VGGGGAAGDLELSVAVGFGPSHVATVAAAGHRFFVVGGREVALAAARGPSIGPSLPFPGEGTPGDGEWGGGRIRRSRGPQLFHG